jgi:drug/metabolite transporter (DMT)-like permease
VLQKDGLVTIGDGETAGPGPDAERGAGAGTMSGLAAVCMWGLAPVATRALVVQLAPVPILVLRLALAGAVLLPRCTRAVRRLDRSSLIRLLAAGLLGMVGYNLPVTVGLQWLSASAAALILATEPIWILILGWAFLGERVPRWSWAGAAVAIGGVATMAVHGVLSSGSGGRQLLGTGLVALGALSFGAYTIVLRPLSRSYGSLTATAMSTVAGALPYLAFAGLISAHQLAALHPTAWGELVFLALGSTVAGMLLWNLAVLRIGSAEAGLLLFLVPLIGVAGGVFFLGERLSPSMGIGGVLIMVGVIIAWTAQRKG